MGGLLSGVRVVEGSAFAAAPLGGLTLAQLGADVIHFDQIGGGLDYHRWPLAANGQSLFWAGLNKGKRPIEIDLGSTAGRELATALLTAGDQAGLFLTNFPARGWRAYESLAKRSLSGTGWREISTPCRLDANHQCAEALVARGPDFGLTSRNNVRRERTCRQT